MKREAVSRLINKPITYVFDLDGVIYRGMELLPHASESVQELRRRGRKIFFLTNNSTLSREIYQAKLSSMGIPADADDIMTSAYATALYLSESGAAGRSVYVVGEDGLISELESVGMRVVRDCATDCVDYVVVGLERGFNYEKLTKAQQAIIHGARFVATNCDATFPLEAGRVAPGSGSIVSAVKTASGVQPFIVGKPETYPIRKLLEKSGSAPEESVIVGDRIETDVLIGKRLGMRTVLVLTGISTKEDAAAAPAESAPDRVIADLSELLDESWWEE
ncbi:MAG: phosphoglycolate/pyridoxal phosphate family phosphatase [Armatimonadetes bacterium]|nr:phosphoglycolate/pyridoxal phosphate family phosphatase [Armatimonadota bacterium]